MVSEAMEGRLISWRTFLMGYFEMVQLPTVSSSEVARCALVSASTAVSKGAKIVNFMWCFGMNNMICRL